MTRILLTPPLPIITAAEARLAARMDGTELDAEILSAIEGARQLAEQATGRRYGQQVWRYRVDAWADLAAGLDCADVSTVAVSYWTGAAWALVPPADVAWDEAQPGRVQVVPALGKAWPSLGAAAIGPRIRVDVTCGKAPPDCVKLFVKAHVIAWLMRPEAVSDRPLTANPMLDRLLDPERTFV